MTEKVGQMTWPTYVRILNQFPYKPYSIKLNWRGEPLLHKHIADFVRYAKEQGIHEVSFNTNGTLLTEELIKCLCDAGLDWIIFSVDGATPKTYENIRQGGSFEKVYKNIALTGLYVHAEGVSTKMRIQMCLMPENKHEVELWKATFAPLANEIRIGKLHDPQGKRGTKVSIPKSCPSFWQRLTISYKGDIMPCPSDYQCKWKLGNVDSISIHDAWHSPTMKNFRKTLSRYGRKEVPPCKNCSSYC